jgi:oligopeptidase A
MNSSASAPSGNPLVRTSGLPDFATITPEHVEPAVTWMIAELERDIEAIESNIVPTWDGLMAPLERLGILFEYVWGPVRHLLGVKNSEPLREAFQKMQPEVVKLGLRLSQSRPIYEGMMALKEGDDWSSLTEAQQRVVELKLREAKLAGVGLEGKDKERFLTIAQELSQISTDYGNNVLDATKAFQLIIDDASKTEGWPNTLRQVAAQSYNQAKDDDAPAATPEGGPWRITLDMPSLVPFMQHHRDRADRERLLLAHMTRASDGKMDNTENISRILKLRREMAALLGFETFADQSLESKMAPDVAAVEQMFDELMSASKEHARKDLGELRELAKASGQAEELAHWDVAFWPSASASSASTTPMISFGLTSRCPACSTACSVSATACSASR